MKRLHKEICFWLLVLVFLAGSMALGYVANAESIDCDKAVREQTGTPRFGHPEVCIEFKKPLKKPVNSPFNAPNRAVVESSICEDGYGCHPIDAEGNIDTSKWWMSEPVSNGSMGVLA